MLLIRDDYGYIVEVNVGKDDNTRKFKIHKGLLCFYSGYFQAALNGRFDEARENVVNLASQSPATFLKFQHWLYSRRISLSHDFPSAMHELVDLWIFGDAHAVLLLQNEVINLLQQFLVDRWVSPWLVVSRAYDNTVTHAPLRRILIDFIGATGSAHWISKNAPEELDCNREALLDLLGKVTDPKLKLQERNEIERWWMCHYHIHEESTKCNTSYQGGKPSCPRKRRREMYAHDAC